MGTPPPWAQYYQQWPPLSPPSVLGNMNNTSFQPQSTQNNWQQPSVQVNHPKVVSYSMQASTQPASPNNSLDKQPADENQLTPDPLVSALAVPGKPAEPILSIVCHVLLRNAFGLGSILILHIFWKLIQCQKMKNHMSLHIHLTPLSN